MPVFVPVASGMLDLATIPADSAEGAVSVCPWLPMLPPGGRGRVGDRGDQQ